MYEIKENVTNNIVINKSNFITRMFIINNESEVANILADIKKEYKDATHYCYAYITKTARKSSDDGEPGGTAGIPIMEVLLKNNITNILCVVIRYFGGIKLGAGGLIRAYSRSVKEALQKTKLLTLIPSIKIKLKFEYDKAKIIDNILTNIIIENKEFNETITYIINIDSKNTDVMNKLKNICISYEILEESTIKNETT